MSSIETALIVKLLVLNESYYNKNKFRTDILSNVPQDTSYKRVEYLYIMAKWCIFETKVVWWYNVDKGSALLKGVQILGLTVLFIRKRFCANLTISTKTCKGIKIKVFSDRSTTPQTFQCQHMPSYSYHSTYIYVLTEWD